MTRLLAVLLLCCAGCSPGAPAWEVVAEDPGGWVVSVSASAGRILAVGGQKQQVGAAGKGVVTLVRGEAPARLSRLDSPRQGMLWWVHALSDTVAWMAGEGGTVLRYEEGPDGTPALVAIPTATDATLYGVWAFSDDDVWAVGGGDGRPGVVLHGGRGGLQVEPGVPRTATLYKIFATGPQHLFLVGAAGVTLRRSGGGWQMDPPAVPLTDSLLSAWGSGPAEVYAVGGSGQGRVLRFDGTAWTALPTERLNGLAGVFLSPDGELLVAGQGGTVATRRDGGPFALAAPVTDLDLHAVYGLAGAAGERFAVGGNLSQDGAVPPRGVILHRGGPSRAVAP